MKKYNIINNKGVTLVAVSVTIIILVIISGIVIKMSKESTEVSEEQIQLSELEIVQHSILERYTKASLTNEKLPGTGCSSEDLNILKNLGINLKDEINSNYYKISKDNGFSELGINNSEDEYIVNYITGEAFNLTKKKTRSGKILYIYAKENK